MFSPHIKLFLKIKRGLQLVTSDFWIKICLLLYCINLPNFIVWLPLLCEILSNMRIAIVFPAWPKSRDKNLNILRTKRAFKMKQKEILTSFKGLSMKQITQILLARWGSDFKRRFSNYVSFSKFSNWAISVGNTWLS